MDFLEQVEAAIRATTIHSTKTYSWFGQYSPRIHASLRGALTPQIERSYLLHNLKSQLYRDFYCPGFPVSAHFEPGSDRTLGMTPFVRALSAANNGCGLYDDGWSVVDLKGENLVVSKAGLELWTRRADCRI